MIASLSRAWRAVLLPLALALAYALTGWVSLRVAIPPDYVSLVFVPAGLGLVAALTWGAPAWLGVALGSLTLNAVTNLHAQVPLLGLNLLVTPAAAALQAAAGAWLVRRWVGYPNPLDAPGRVLAFLALGGPLACLLNASLSVPALVHMGAIPVPEALFSWWTWWLGDALGVALTAPLLLVWLGRPREAWRKRGTTVAMPLVVAMGLAGATFHQVRESEERNLAAGFETEARELARLLQRRLDAQSDSVLSVAKLLEFSTLSRQADFREAVTPWLRRYSGTQNFGWSPLVAAAERDSFERARRDDGLRDFRILGRDTQGRTFAALPATYHLPITLVEPLESNRSVLGLDVLVLPATSEAVMATQISGRPEVTQGIRLVQENQQQRGVVMYQAVFERQADGTPYGPLKGVVSAVFRMDDVLAAALGASMAPSRLLVCLIDPQGREGNQRLVGADGCESAEPAARALSLQLPVRFADRFWELRLSEGPAYRATRRSWTAWATVALGLAAVGMLGVFLVVITGQGRQTQLLVDQRTAELAGSNAQLVQLAHFDPLTGLANRKHWMDQAQATLEVAQQNGDQFGVMFIDLDRFKHVNDSLGHSQGDRLLATVASRLRECLRGRDVLARLGGDEFVILLPRLRDREGAAVAARKVMAALSRPIPLDAHEVSASASVGLACYPRDGDSIETLLRHADTAMYAAKDAGRNGWRFFAHEMNEHLSQRMFIEMGLRRALQNGELFLQYQPQVDARSGRLVGAEALVRWRHPEQGLIGPDRFIAVAEDSGLIEVLGRWVLDEACRQLRAWEDSGLRGLHLAVNISALEFNRPHFLEQVNASLSDAGVNPAQIELEITESLLMQALPELRERLGELTALGLQLALDDFGTGYSSLGYLKRLPISRLKIDRSFVAGVPGSPEGEAIIRATLSMAHDLGLGVVAEGVETEDQRDFLLSHGCERLQGFLIARPMNADAFATWWRQRLDARTPGASSLTV
ncbi:bifunctional diguanylate cyclase/phosphodiesterase [Hydrogenophaga sp. OTU3427]|uniref:bifunctional diguanylate cyclase/phosphodiesterase n=1 Tax=Hydrogenophaga sp. OTU3427 TaxID=3043856 RepID=UPI00313C195C